MVSFHSDMISKDTTRAAISLGATFLIGILLFPERKPEEVAVSEVEVRIEQTFEPKALECSPTKPDLSELIRLDQELYRLFERRIRILESLRRSGSRESARLESSRTEAESSDSPCSTVSAPCLVDSRSTSPVTESPEICPSAPRRTARSGRSS